GMTAPGADATGFNKTGPGNLTLSGNTYDLGSKPFLFRAGTLTLQNNATFNNTGALAAFTSIGVAGTGRASLVMSDTSSMSVGEGINIADTNDTRSTIFVRDNARIEARGVFLGKNNTAQGAGLQTGGLVTSRAGVATLDWRIGGNNNDNQVNA